MMSNAVVESYHVKGASACQMAYETQALCLKAGPVASEQQRKQTLKARKKYLA
jgi:hypothetical protein